MLAPKSQHGIRLPYLARPLEQQWLMERILLPRQQSLLYFPLRDYPLFLENYVASKAYHRKVISSRKIRTVWCKYYGKNHII